MKSLSEQVGPDVTSLSTLLVSALRTLINGNQVQADDLKAGVATLQMATIRLQLDWAFQAETTDIVNSGSMGQADHHLGDDEAAFAAHSEALQQQAQTNRALRRDFLAGVVAAGADFLPRATTQTIHEFPLFSVCEECDKCGGHGKVRCSHCGGDGTELCSSCGGSGYYEEYETDHRGDSYSVRKTCWGCSGSGYCTCFNCYGSGEVRCDSCNGAGFFTRCRMISVTAVPAPHFTVSDAFSAEAFTALLEQEPLTFTASRIPFELKTWKESEKTAHFGYQGFTPSLRQPFSLLGKGYVCEAFGNPPYPYIRPPFFDDLFADELTYLQQTIPKPYRPRSRLGKRLWDFCHIAPSRPLRHHHAQVFFQRYIKQPVLDEALRQMAQAGERGETFATAVTKACHGYISPQFAEQFSTQLTFITNGLSPRYDFWVWQMAGLPLLYYAFFVSEAIIENAAHHGFWQGLFRLSWHLSKLLLEIGLIATIASAIAVLWRRRHLPHPYRQRPRSYEPFLRLARRLLLIGLSGVCYGWLASRGWLPSLSWLPLDTLLAPINTLIIKPLWLLENQFF
jgi:hypothetical protein